MTRWIHVTWGVSAQTSQMPDQARTSSGTSGFTSVTCFLSSGFSYTSLCYFLEWMTLPRVRAKSLTVLLQEITSSVLPRACTSPLSWPPFQVFRGWRSTLTARDVSLHKLRG